MGFWKKLEILGHKFTSPQGFDKFALRTNTWLTPLSWIMLFIALLWGLAFAPSDQTQGNVYRIIYIHVPLAVLSMSIFAFMAVSALIYFIWRFKIALFFLRVAAPYGALITALALITGSIWGKPTWGTYWTWDARLTSELILLFIYLAIILLQHGFDDRKLSDQMSAIVAIIGVINLPIIHYSVIWWNSLHQGATLLKFTSPSIDPSMLWPLLLSLLAFHLIFASYAVKQMQNLILTQRISRQMEG